MSNLPTRLYRAAQVRELDRIAIEEHRIPGYTLMRRAGQASFDVLRTRWPEARQLLVVVGTGNNGGDGYVIALLALQAGWQTRVCQIGDATRIRGDALHARTDYLDAGGQEQAYAGDNLAASDVVVDALFGTGLERNVEGVWKSAIDAINVHPAPKLAVDIPSGLHSDTGMPLGTAVQAHCTVSFIGLKQGLFTGAAADYCGEVVFADLDVPDVVFTELEPAASRIDGQQVARLLRPRSRVGHKGRYGHVLVVGGDQGMSGAARLAGEAAARGGAGLVSVATHPAHASGLNLTCPVLMVHGVANAHALEPLLERCTVVAVGPGIGQHDWARSLFGSVCALDKPMVVDADALNVLAREPTRSENWVLTPHPGEAARLLQTDTATVQKDRFTAVEMLQDRFGGVSVLKGSGTLIRSHHGTTICTAGNPGMASGGMGDLLTGIIAALLAQGFCAEDAARVGVWLHASAADAAAQAGERGLLATDLFPALRRLLNP